VDATLIAANGTALANWSQLSVGGLIKTIHIWILLITLHFPYFHGGLLGQMKLYEL